jgi:hypothetical protein
MAKVLDPTDFIMEVSRTDDNTVVLVRKTAWYWEAGILYEYTAAEEMPDTMTATEVMTDLDEALDTQAGL